MDSELIKKIQRSLLVAEEHPQIVEVSEPNYTDCSNTVFADVTFEVPLYQKDKLKGQSSTGVKSQETVRFHFNKKTTLYAPMITLREDFNRNLPHFYPSLYENRFPIPCIYNGEISELYQMGGMAKIYDQVAEWLDNAASESLMSKSHGWDPVRRDSFSSILTCDIDHIRDLVTPNIGFKFFELDRFLYQIKGIWQCTSILNSKNELKISANGLLNIANSVQTVSGFRIQKGLALIVWPSGFGTMKYKVCKEYLPETVQTYGELKERAENYYCLNELRGAMIKLKKFGKSLEGNRKVPLVIILLANRPYNLIGSDSNKELCTYEMGVSFPELIDDGSATKVFPTAIRHALTPKLLNRMTKFNPSIIKNEYALLGAGSLGSKLATHLARSGICANSIVDKSNMSPHNYARHALTPQLRPTLFNSGVSKSHLLSLSLEGFRDSKLSQPTKVYFTDTVALLNSKSADLEIFGNKSKAIVNTTASLVVRRALTSSEHVNQRVIECCLFSKGNVGVVTVEGNNRNPNTGDLMVEAYALFRENESLQQKIFFEHNEPDGLDEIEIGQGCSSLSMKMSDSQLSLFSAGMAEYLLQLFENGISDDNGIILIGRLDNNGLGVNWDLTKIPRVRKACVSNSQDWRVHIHNRVHEYIIEDINKHAPNETGGLIVGNYCESTNTFNVVDTIEAPEDSKRERHYFELGKKDKVEKIANYAVSTKDALHYIGTWHNHHEDIGPSALDCETCRKIAKEEGPTLKTMIIRTPKRYFALLSDPASSE